MEQAEFALALQHDSSFPGWLNFRFFGETPLIERTSRTMNVSLELLSRSLSYHWFALTQILQTKKGWPSYFKTADELNRYKK